MEKQNDKDTDRVFLLLPLTKVLGFLVTLHHLLLMISLVLLSLTLQTPLFDLFQLQLNTTRSQAVARIADRTASQHLRGSRDVIGHVTIW